MSYYYRYSFLYFWYIDRDGYIIVGYEDDVEDTENADDAGDENAPAPLPTDVSNKMQMDWWRISCVSAKRNSKMQ